MRRILKASLVVMVLLLGGYLSFVNRGEISAAIWHLTHGHSQVVGDYVIPVPNHWLVKVYDEGNLITLTGTQGWVWAGRSSRLGVIAIYVIPRTQDLDLWASGSGLRPKV